MLFNIDKKIALVTGAGRGNGASIAKGLASAGAQVIVVDVDGENAKQTAELIRATEGKRSDFGVSDDQVVNPRGLRQALGLGIASLGKGGGKS